MVRGKDGWIDRTFPLFGWVEWAGIVLFPFGPAILLPSNFGGGGRAGGVSVFKCLMIMVPTNHFPFSRTLQTIQIPKGKRPSYFFPSLLSLCFPFHPPLFWNIDLIYFVSFAAILMRKHINVELFFQHMFVI